MSQLKGTVWSRPNGTWTVQGEKVWNPRKGKFLRPSLGTFSTQGEAEAAQVTYTDQVNRDSFVLDEAALRNMTVTKYLSDWCGLLEREAATGRIARRTYLDYKSVVNTHLIPRIGDITIGSISPNVIRRMLLAVSEQGMSDRTVEKVYRTLHRALGDSDLASNPVRLPKRHRPQGRTSPRKEYPPPEAVRAFLTHLASCPKAKRTRVSLPLQLISLTGLRLAEACGLAWSDLDLANGTLTVEYTLQTATSNLAGKSGYHRCMRLERVGLVVGGLVCLGITPWFALAYFRAYAVPGEVPPPWLDWVDWPGLISGDTVSVYHSYGVIFGVGLAIVVGSLAILVRNATPERSGIRRSWMVIAAGLGAVALGSLLEYGFGEGIIVGFGFFVELLGTLAMMVGTGFLGRSLHKGNDLEVLPSVAVGTSGFLGVVVGFALLRHIPSGPALVPLIAAVVFGFTGLPFSAVGLAADSRT